MTDDRLDGTGTDRTARPAPGRTGPLVGRERELDELAGLVARTRAHGHALVLEGTAGAGKSRLVAEAATIASTAGFRQLWFRITPDPQTAGPADPPGARVPARGCSNGLPRGQPSALLTALERFHAPTPEPLLARLAVLGILEEAARGRPLLVVVEDVQWMDPWVTDLVGFVGRRLSRAPILILVASRPGQARRLDRYKLPRLDVGALGRGECERILDDLPGPLSATARSRALRESAGNPSALIELAAPQADQTAGARRRPPPADPVSAFAAVAERPRAVPRVHGQPTTGAPATAEVGSSAPAVRLTDQELRIARLAAAGLTNREIAARVFLSHRTVGANLYRAFPKLGVDRRWQLRRALQGGQHGDLHREEERSPASSARTPGGGVKTA